MTDTTERAPGIPAGLFLTPTERDDLRARLAEIEQRAVALSAEIAGIVADLQACPMHEPGDPDCTPTHGGACLGRHDPLAPYRTPTGTVAYLTVPVGALQSGDWFQRCHGDPDWHHVRPLIFTAGQVGVPFDDSGLEWFAGSAMVRVARPAAYVATLQEREAER